MKKGLWNRVKRAVAAVMAVALLTTVICINEEPEVMPLVDVEEEAEIL